MTKRQLTRFGGFPLPNIKMPAFYNSLGSLRQPRFCVSQKRHKYSAFPKRVWYEECEKEGLVTSCLAQKFSKNPRLMFGEENTCIAFTWCSQRNLRTYLVKILLRCWWWCLGIWKSDGRYYGGIVFVAQYLTRLLILGPTSWENPLSLSPHSHSITFSEIARLSLDTPPSHFPFLSDFFPFRNPPSRSPLLPIIKGSSAKGFGCVDEHRFKSEGFRIRRSDT